MGYTSKTVTFFPIYLIKLFYDVLVSHFLQ
jgi:hypothetical protein